MDQKKRTEIASLGQFGLIDLLTSGFTPKNASTLKGAGDDAAVIAPGRGEAVLCTTDSFYEGVDFDLTYFPLKHLGYKAVTAGVSDILAMNALPAQITVSLGVSSKTARRSPSGGSTKASPSPARSRRSTSWAATRAPR